MNINKRKLIGFIIGLIFFSITVTSLTYAYYAWQSANTNVTFDINDQYFYCETDINSGVSNLSPVQDYKDGVLHKFKVNNIANKDTTFSITMNIESIDDALKHESFKYKLMVDKSNGNNDCSTGASGCEEVASGNFKNVHVGNNNLVPSIELLNNSRYEYYFFMYIDGTMENPTEMQTASMVSTLGVCDIYVTFDTSVGDTTVTPMYKKIIEGEKYGTLPTPTRNNAVVTYNTNDGDTIENDTVSFTFNGWYKEQAFTNVVNSDTTVTSSVNHTLYPKWTKSKTITLPTPTKNGNTFAGWYSDSELTNKVGDAGDSYNPEKSVTLYAKWNSNIYKVNLNGNGVTNNGTTVIYEKYGVGWYSDSAATNKITTVTLPTRDGYTFNGYYGYEDGSGTNFIKANGEINYPYGTATTINNLTIYAKWTINTYNITYKDCGNTSFSGTHTSGYPTTYTYGTGATLDSPIKTGYTFSGYYSTETCSGTRVTSIGTTESGNKTFYAKWSMNNPTTPTISGGTTKVYNNSDTTLTCSTTSTYASGTNIYYEFGYATSTDNFTTGTITWLGNSSTTKTLNIPKTAYRAVRYYTCRVYASDGTSMTDTVQATTTTTMTIVNARVYFNATTNGGTISGSVRLYIPYGQTNIYAGRENTTEGTIPLATKAGYTFTGWYTAATGGTKVINADRTVQASVSGWTDASKQWLRTLGENNDTSNVLYAQYEPNTYTATFYYNSTNGCGTLTATAVTNSCTVTGNSSNCTVSVPDTVQNSVGKYNSTYYGVSSSTGNMTAVSTITLTEDAKYYAIYSKAIDLYHPSSTSETEKITAYRNEWFTNATGTSSNQVIASTQNSTTALTVSVPNTYTLEGFNTAVNKTSITSGLTTVTTIANDSSCRTSYYAIGKKTSGNITFKYSNSNTGTIASATATGTIKVYSTSTSAASINNGTVSPTVTHTAPYETTFIGWKNAVNNMASLTTSPTTASTTWYAVYRSQVTNYYYNSSWTNRTLYRNSYVKAASDTKYTTVLSTTNTGLTSNVTDSSGPGNSNYYGTMTCSSGTIEDCNSSNIWENTSQFAESSASIIYSFYFMNINYSKGANVSAIEKTKDSCDIYYNNTSCTVTLPSITPNTGYSSVGWSTTNGATTGTAEGSTYNISTNGQALYANALKNINVSFESDKNVLSYYTENVSAWETSGGNPTFEKKTRTYSGNTWVDYYIDGTPEKIYKHIKLKSNTTYYFKVYLWNNSEYNITISIRTNSISGTALCTNSYTDYDEGYKSCTFTSTTDEDYYILFDFGIEQKTIDEIYFEDFVLKYDNSNGEDVKDYFGTKTVLNGYNYGTLPDASHAGYAFDGWYTSSSGGTEVTSSTIVNRTEDHTLYAKFSSTIANPQNVTITGGETKVYNYSATTLTCNTTSTYSSGVDVFYQFGYKTSPSGSITWIGSESKTQTKTISKSEFHGIRYYVCRIYATSGDVESDIIQSSTSTTMGLINARIDFDATTNGGTINGTNPLYVVYGFSSYYNSRTTNMTVAIDAVGDNITSEKINLYALPDLNSTIINNSYVGPFWINYGSETNGFVRILDEDEILKGYVKKSDVSIDDADFYATKPGYRFKGWYTAATGGEQVINEFNLNNSNISGWTDSNGAFILTNTSDTENTYKLYAQFGSFSSTDYNIYYNLVGGTHGDNHPTSANKDEIIPISKPNRTYTINININSTGATLSTPTASKAQTFLGWTANYLDTTNARYGTTSTNVNTAWTNKEQKVGASSNPTYYKNLALGEDVELKANWNAVDITLPTITKIGYTCGYATSSSATEITYDSGGIYTPTTSELNSIYNDKTLYAVCKKTATITFDSMGGTTPNPSNITKTIGTTLGTLPSVSKNNSTNNNWYCPSYWPEDIDDYRVDSNSLLLYTTYPNGYVYIWNTDEEYQADSSGMVDLTSTYNKNNKFTLLIEESDNEYLFDGTDFHSLIYSSTKMWSGGGTCKANYYYRAQVVVNNGTVNGTSSLNVIEGTNPSFSLSPSQTPAAGTVSCTNSQVATLSENTLTINNITDSTVCTVTYITSPTTLYSDGTLIINEPSTSRTSNINSHGAVSKEYPGLSNSNTYIWNSPTEQIWRNEKDSIKTIQIGQTIYPTSTAYWFEELLNATSASFTNLNTSNVTNMSYMFNNFGANSNANCSSLFGGINEWDTSNVTNMSYMFSVVGVGTNTCSLNLSNWNTSNVTNMQGMFDSMGYSSSTITLTGLNNWNVSKVTNMSYMFSATGEEASSINIGNLSNWNTSKVTNMEGMFSTTGYYATTWNSIGTLKVYATNIKNMFNDCKYCKATLNIYSNPTTYTTAFSNAATQSGALITVNYKSTTTNINNIIATKSSGSNVVKGNVIS